MTRRLIALLLCICMIGSMTVYAVGDEEETVCTCGTETEEHAEDCALYVEPAPSCTCGTETEEHAEDCALYEAPAEDEEATEPQDDVGDDAPGAPENEPTYFETVMAAESVEDMYIAFLSDQSAAASLTADELDQLIARAAELKDSVGDPSGDYDEFIETLEYLKGELELEGDPETNAATANSGKASGTMTGVQFLATAKNNAIQLDGNVALTSEIQVASGKTLTIDLNGHMLRATGKHRVLYINGGTVTIKDSRPTATTHKGNLVKVTSWRDKRLNYSLFTNGKALYDTNTLFPDRFDLHTSAEAELWVYDSSGTVSIKGGLITGGKSVYGGGIHVTNKGKLTISGGTIAGCAVYRFFDATLSGTACIPSSIPASGFGYNNSSPNGGGLYCAGGATVTMTGGTIMYNWADYCGGGVYTGGEGTVFTMNGGTVTDNFCRGEGGGLAVRTGSVFNFGHSTGVPVISKNKTDDRNYTGGGGGISISSAKIDFRNGKITENRAQGSGGGIYCYRGGDVTASASSVISNNSGGTGGGIYIQYGTVTLNGSTVEGNEARTGSGGAVSGRVGNFIMNGGILRNNKAKTNGGAVNVTAQNNVAPHYDNGHLGGSASLKNAQIYGNTSGSLGGAIYVSVGNSTANTTVEVDSCKIYDNTAVGLGGAIAVSGGTLTVKGSSTEVYNNKGKGGGAFYVEDSVRTSGDARPYTVNKTAAEAAGLTYNTSGWWSGAIVDYVTYKTDTRAGTVVIEAGSYHDNLATSTHGGVLYVTGTKSTVTIDSGTFSNNTAPQNGGAVYVNGGTVTLNNGTFNNNTATQSGGAMYVNGGNITMANGTLSSNSAASDGGAVCVNGGNFTMNGGTIGGSGKSNTASNNGGAVYVSGGEFKMTNGTISYNTAKLGGGAYVSGTSSKKGNVLVEHGVLTNNTATNGGAVYVSGGDFTMKSGTIANNAATNATVNTYGGGVYANNGNIVIGVNGCTQTSPCASHDKSPSTEITHHPIVTGNTADFGGGLMVNNGTVTLYCCNIDANTADNAGTGMNVFMSGANGEINHYYQGAIIGDDTDHGMVSIGGVLNIYQASAPNDVNIIYHSNNQELTGNADTVWNGVVPENYYLNLPYCPQDWQTATEAKGYTFVGWTVKPLAATDASAVRTKDHYKAIGTPTQILDTEDGETVATHLYAVWAPIENHITYTYSLDGVAIVEEQDGKTNFGTAPETYTFQMFNSKINIPNPARAGYEFQGWKMYAKNTKISNWDMDASNYEPTLIAEINPADAYLAVPLDVTQNFGDIVMVAVFEPMFADLTIKKTGANLTADPNQSFLFHVVGDADDGKSDIELDVVVTGNSSGEASVKINHLPVGKYTVTEITTWSWRYTPKNAALSIELKDPNKVDYAVTFANTRTKDQWLDGDSFCKNMWINAQSTRSN